MSRLFLLFALVTVGEMVLLVRMGRWIGFWGTLGLVVVTAYLGAALARSQGIRALARAQAELRAGRVPEGPMLDGLCVLVAAVLLITPGVLTDAFGLLLLLPPFRAPLKVWLLARFRRWMEEGTVHVYRAEEGFGPGPGDPREPSDPDVIDVEAIERD